MKYFLIEISTKEDKIEKAIYEYDDKVTAIANLHTKLGGAMKSDAYLAEVVMVIDANGSVQASDNFIREVAPEVEPEVEGE